MPGENFKLLGNTDEIFFGKAVTLPLHLLHASLWTSAHIMALCEQQGLVRGTGLWHFEMAHLTPAELLTSTSIGKRSISNNSLFKKQKNPTNKDKLLYKIILFSMTLKYAQ